MQSTSTIGSSLTQYVAQKAQSDMASGAIGALQNGSAITAIGLGLGAGAIAGTVYATAEYHSHTKAKHIKQIKEIEAIRGRRLKIIAPGTRSQEIPLCCIFEFDKKDPTQAKSS